MTGPVHDLRTWAKHLMQHHDKWFTSDQLLSLYVFNTLQRHDNNNHGNFFRYNRNWIGLNPPTIEDIMCQIKEGHFTFISKLRYFSEIRGSNGYWRSKPVELQSWIDFSRVPTTQTPTHFITLTCAENWWPDLCEMNADLECNAEGENRWGEGGGRTVRKVGER